ncbi:hypothetical protein B9D94_12310 [Paenibacillus sp. Cedars]|nr:hypothetical protein B9D94_12310 [Paenibacillus sp. Cedars]
MNEVDGSGSMKRMKLEQWMDICKLMNDNLGLPMHYCNPHRRIEYSLMPAGISSQGQKELQERMIQLISSSHRGEVQGPYMLGTSLLENFIETRIEENGVYMGSLIAGPSIYSRIRKDMLVGLARDHRITDRDALERYYDRLVIMDKKKLLHAAAMLHYLVYHTRIDITDVMQHNHGGSRYQGLGENIDIQVSEQRINVSFHHDPIYEKELMQLVTDGRPEELVNKLELIQTTEGIGTLSRTSHVRHQKNLSIVGIALMTRAAVEGGLHPEIAYTMSDLYIQQMEEMTDANEVNTALQQATYDFANRVKECKEGDFSKAVVKCKQYIFNHLYEDVSLQQLSRSVHMNSSYLSRRFKQETGVSISEYIQGQRIEEAKKLLVLTDLPISVIYARLNYHDQSYFTKVFRKLTGVTPKQYREGRRLKSTHSGEDDPI